MKWLKKVQKKKSFELPAVIAQMFVHKLRPKIDQDAIKDLEGLIRGMEELADAHALRCAIKLCALFRNLSLGRRLAKRLLTMPGGEFSRPLLGWLEIARDDNKSSTLASALQHFEQSLQGKRARCAKALACHSFRTQHLHAFTIVRQHSFHTKRCMCVQNGSCVLWDNLSVVSGHSMLFSAKRWS